MTTLRIGDLHSLLSAAEKIEKVFPPTTLTSVAYLKQRMSTRTDEELLSLTVALDELRGVARVVSLVDVFGQSNE